MKSKMVEYLKIGKWINKNQLSCSEKELNSSLSGGGELGQGGPELQTALNCYASVSLKHK